MKKQLFIVLVFAFAISLKAQNNLRPNAYMYDQSYTNAAVGLEYYEKSNVSLYGKTKIVANPLWQKPMNVMAAYRARIPSVTGFYSVGFAYDGYSFYDRNTLFAGYAYQLMLSNISCLQFGARAVLNFDFVDWDKLPQIPQPPSQSLYFNPDLDLGIQYILGNFTAGISGKNLFAVNAKADEEIIFQNRREWYANASYRFNIGCSFAITPYALAYHERKSGFDLGSRFSFYNFVNLAYHFRLNEVRNVFSVGVNVHDAVKIGAAFDHSMIGTGHNLDFYLAYCFK